MSWVEKFRKINQRGGGGGMSISDLRVRYSSLNNLQQIICVRKKDEC